MTEFSGLGVIISLPVQLPDSRKTQPYKNKRKALRVISDPIQEIITEVEAVHQCPRIGTHFLFNNLFGQIRHVGIDV